MANFTLEISLFFSKRFRQTSRSVLFVNKWRWFARKLSVIFFVCLFSYSKRLAKDSANNSQGNKDWTPTNIATLLVEFSPFHHVPPVSINIETVILITNTITFLNV